ncbi:MAG: 5-aminolevulic acid synthase [Litoreibacter sp.]|uniref:5-aminolevulic acid synthase n=1 Tax=Litoreibacter sp. TaxID=1969459 RepID=UPI003297FDE4
MNYTMRSSVLAILVASFGGIASAESLTFKEVRKILPKGSRVVAELPDTSFLDEKQQAIVLSLKDTIPFYGALALTADEGLFVDWLSASGQHHSLDAARTAALDYCNANRKAESAGCVVVLEVSPKGHDADAILSLSADATDTFRKEYRKLGSPKAFAISKSQGTFGFAGGDGARALDACAKAGEGASDCTVVVAD